MSYDAERWARSQKVGNASAKFVLIELANALNRETGKCYPSIEALQEATELNRKTVIAATKHLEEKGFITKRRSFVNGKQIVYYGFPSFKPADWESKNKSTKTGTLESTENGTLPHQSTEIGTLESTENGTTESTKNGTDDSTEIGTYESTVFGTVTRNKNKEIEQGSRTGNSLTAQAPWETDHLTNDGKKVEKPKATRAKPKTSCPFSPDDPIPPEYLEYARAKHPSINAQTEFTKFVNFHLSKDNRYSNWLAAWRYWVGNIKTYSRQTQRSTNIRFEGHDNDFSCIYG
jgi:pyocin large subunit-like protein